MQIKINMQIKTRFAPSPTGFIHIGNVRTALFSWLYAKKYKGKFLIRIDDTDTERNSIVYKNNIFNVLNWLNIKSDEKIFHQSEKYNRYKNILEILIKDNKAYKCFCTKERLEKLKEFQLKNKKKICYDGFCKEKKEKHDNFIIRINTDVFEDLEFHDSIKGKILIMKSELNDFIIAKKNFHPTYNFASVIDDIDCNITDIIRGDDHISNTPKQIIIFKTLNAGIPHFTHLPMILDENKKPLSKRDKESRIDYYKDHGFLPQALLNYILRLGWAHKDKEIFSKEEMIDLFNITNITNSPGIMNKSKLIWLNKYYIKKSSKREILIHLLNIEKKIKLNYFVGPDLNKLIDINRNKVNTIEEIIINNLFLYTECINIDRMILISNINDETIHILTDIYKKIIIYTDIWNIENIKNLIKNILLDTNLQLDKFANLFRLIITGTNNPNSIYDLIFLTGKILLLKKIKHIIKQYKMGL